MTYISSLLIISLNVCLINNFFQIISLISAKPKSFFGIHISHEFLKLFARIINIVILKGLPKYIQKRWRICCPRIWLSVLNIWHLQAGNSKLATLSSIFSFNEHQIKTYCWLWNSVSNSAPFETKIKSPFFLRTNFDFGGAIFLDAVWAPLG